MRVTSTDSADSVSESTPILDFLGRHRWLLLVAYVVAFSLWVLTTAVLDKRLLAPSVLSAAIGDPDDVDFHAQGGWIIVGAFVALQVLFLWGGGRVVIDAARSRARKLIVPVLVGATLLALLAVGLLGSALEMTDRYGSNGTIRGHHDSTGSALLGVIAAAWLFWVVAGVAWLRSKPQPTALARILAALLAGSWIEFCVALPVELGTRTRTRECPCSSGSWLALAFGVPMLLWCFGPGVYLLYVREKRLALSDPTRARRILRARTRLRRTGAAR